ncbi:HNH endonuclease [Cyanobium sp. N5-Cardenillas]|nr:HNH endonuclease [Cyanobium sp. N5-Cardenillas]
MIKLVAHLSCQEEQAVRNELLQHLGSRAFFLLLAEISHAPNFFAIQNRIANSLMRSNDEVNSIVTEVSRTHVSMSSASLGRRSSLRDLTPEQKRRLLQSQQNRCGHCGWNFNSQEETRTKYQSQPTLDHKVPYRIGGDHDSNLWILCGLCNSMKKASIHIGESGSVWIDNAAYPAPRGLVAFWVLWRHRHCTATGCRKGPSDARLFVTRLNNAGPWVPGNCTVRCAEHHTGNVINY